MTNFWRFIVNVFHAFMRSIFMKVNITVARPDLIPDIWDVVFPMLKPALKDDLMLNEEILKNGLIEDKSLLFIATVDGAIKGAAVVQVQDMSHKTAWVTAIGGKGFKIWYPALDEALQKYASHIDCSHLIFLGSRAWQRLTRDYTQGKQVFFKEVTKWAV
jgi:hypothetical protein